MGDEQEVFTVATRRRRGGQKTHGLSYTTEYRVWQTMRLRCHEPSNQAYPDYGGRGIFVCNRWRESPVHLLEDMGRKPTPRHEIDRIDNDQGYDCGKCEDCRARGVTKINCRWVSRKENDRNRRSNRRLTIGAESLTMAEWCERYSIAHDTLRYRLRIGWSAERAITTPVRPKRSRRQTELTARRAA